MFSRTGLGSDPDGVESTVERAARRAVLSFPTDRADSNLSKEVGVWVGAASGSCCCGRTSGAHIDGGATGHT